MEKTLSRGKVMVEEMERAQYEINLTGLCLNGFGDGKRKVKDDIPVSSLNYQTKMTITSTEPIFTNYCIPNALHRTLGIKSFYKQTGVDG